MVRRIIDRIPLHRTEPHGYEFVVGPYDYHIRLEGDLWVLDQFRSSVKDAGEAHVKSVEVDSLADGVHFALEELI